jgi:hypothetical protein
MTNTNTDSEQHLAIVTLARLLVEQAEDHLSACS